MTLHVEQLGLERNYQFLLQDIHFHLQSGEWLQVSGKNGSGKSTLLRMLAGFLEPSVGKISWQNQLISTQRELFQQQLHFIGHQNGVKLHLTVLENLKLISALANITTTLAHLEHSAAQMGLQHVLHAEVSKLSAGQLRRLALARLLISPAKLWLLDEPTTALDQAGQKILMELLHQHLSCGGMAVIATHYDLNISSGKKSIELGEKNA